MSEQAKPMNILAIADEATLEAVFNAVRDDPIIGRQPGDQARDTFQDALVDIEDGDEAAYAALRVMAICIAVCKSLEPARLTDLDRLVREVAVSGVEFEDPRLSYVTVQIDRETWEELKRLKEGAPSNG